MIEVKRLCLDLELRLFLFQREVNVVLEVLKSSALFSILFKLDHGGLKLDVVRFICPENHLKCRLWCSCNPEPLDVLCL